MKKRILICVSVLLAIVCLVGVFAVQSAKIVGEDGLIAKARKEITNLAEVETIEMNIAGKSTVDGNRHLFWIVTGNEYQMHRYYPMEVIELDGYTELEKLAIAKEYIVPKQIKEHALKKSNIRISDEAILKIKDSVFFVIGIVVFILAKAIASPVKPSASEPSIITVGFEKSIVSGVTISS